MCKTLCWLDQAAVTMKIFIKYEFIYIEISLVGKAPVVFHYTCRAPQMRFCDVSFSRTQTLGVIPWCGLCNKLDDCYASAMRIRHLITNSKVCCRSPTMDTLFAKLPPHGNPCGELTKCIETYRKVSNIRCTKYQNLNDSRLILQLSVPNPLKPSVKSIMKM